MWEFQDLDQMIFFETEIDLIILVIIRAECLIQAVLLLLF